MVCVSSDKCVIDGYLEAVLPQPGVSVCDAMRYSVLGPGQRLRPILSLRIGRSLGTDERLVLRRAAAVELLHCASLIVDDLPCMDNDPIRRNRPAVHVKFGEATAVLAAFALVALAARTVADQHCFQLKLLSTLDCNALIGGQALDLELSSKTREYQRQNVAAMKTVPLFLLAAEAALPVEELPQEMKTAALTFAREFGTCYQMLDDYLDGEIPSIDGPLNQFERARRCTETFDASGVQFEDLFHYLHAKL